MAEIFLYTPDANINSTHLEVLRKNGFIPVKVATMDAVKIMPMPVGVPRAHLDLLLSAAAAAIESASGDVRSLFGLAVAARLLKMEREGSSPSPQPPMRGRGG